MAVNLDSSRRRTRRAKQARPASRTAPRSPQAALGTPQELRSQMRQTMRFSILDAAEELIGKRGLHDATLAQIARRAGVAVGTLYNYFTDRDALIRGLFESRRATFRPRLLAALRAGSELAFEPRLRGVVRGVFEAFESHRNFLKVAIENEHLKPSGSTTPQDLQSGIDDVVAAGLREGVIAADKVELLAVLISATIKSIAVHRIQAGSELAGDADAIVEIVLDGVRSGAR